MRRKDKEITDIDEKLSIIHKCKICRIALSEKNKPYIIPLNYGYNFENNLLTLFFHSALEGKKMEMMKNNNHACFEIDCDTKLIEAGNPCKYGYAFRSIIGFGKIFFLEETKEKIEGLNRIMEQQTGKKEIYEYSQEALNNVVVYKMAVEDFTGKQKDFPSN